MNNKKIFFTHTPYAGYFKYKDQFLIYPVPNKIEDYVRHKPAIIEFYTEKAEPAYFDDPSLPKHIKFPLPESFAQGQLAHQRYIDLLRLLSLLTNFLHFDYTGYQAWFVPIEPASKDPFIPAKWGQEFTPTIDEGNFGPESECDEIEKKESVSYFGDNLFKRITSKVTYPESMEELLGKYFDLSEQDRNVLNTSIILFTQGLELATNKQSLAIVAFISSIENLITYDHKGEPEDTCKCGEIKYGVTKKFREFVSNFIKAESKTQLKKYVDDIYDLRSKIVHASVLHIGDLDRNFWETSRGKNPFIVNEIEQIARICLINWFNNK